MNVLAAVTQIMRACACGLDRHASVLCMLQEALSPFCTSSLRSVSVVCTGPTDGRASRDPIRRRLLPELCTISYESRSGSNSTTQDRLARCTRNHCRSQPQTRESSHRRRTPCRAATARSASELHMKFAAFWQLERWFWPYAAICASWKQIDVPRHDAQPCCFFVVSHANSGQLHDRPLSCCDSSQMQWLMMQRHTREQLERTELAQTSEPRCHTART